MEKTTNKKLTSTGKSGIYSLLAATVLALATLPTLGFAGQPAAQEKSSFNSYKVSTDVAENYGDINDEEDTANDETETNTGTISMHSPSLTIASNDGSSGVDDGAYADNQEEG